MESFWVKSLRLRVPSAKTGITVAIPFFRTTSVLGILKSLVHSRFNMGTGEDFRRVSEKEWLRNMMPSLKKLI
jgi:hypothetical protein